MTGDAMPDDGTGSVDPGEEEEQEEEVVQDEGDDASGEGEPDVFAAYSLTLEGETSGRQFERAADLYVVPTVDELATTNGVNPIDVCLVSGFPAATPEVGAIWFGTNSGCIPGAGSQDVDAAYVEIEGGGDEVTIRIEPDSDLTAVGLNHYTSDEGLTALLYLIETGTIEFEIRGSQVTGSIDLIGFCGLCTGGPGGNRGDYSGSVSSS